MGVDREKRGRSGVCGHLMFEQPSFLDQPVRNKDTKQETAMR